MTLLWTLIFVSGVFAIAAGAQAVRLLHDANGDFARITRQLAATDAALQQTEKRMEAQEILLRQAGAWLRANHQGQP